MKWPWNFFAVLAAVPFLFSGAWVVFLGVHPRFWRVREGPDDQRKTRRLVVLAGLFLLAGSAFLFSLAF